MTILLTVVVGVLATLGLVAWLSGFSAAPLRSSVRLIAIERRKARTLRSVRAEGTAARARIRAIMRGEQPRPRESKRNAAPWVAAAAVASLVLTLLAIAVIDHPATPSPQERVDAVLETLEVGDCVNFTADFATFSPPTDPSVVSCGDRVATFKVVQKISDNSRAKCTNKATSARMWSAHAGDSVCVTRIYYVGQCMQGYKAKGGGVDWFYDAVVSCATKPTQKYPYLLKIAAIRKYRDDCPRNSFLDHPSYGVHPRYLCIRVAARYGQRKSR